MLEDSGNYDAIVSNTCSAVTSSGASLSVLALPSLTSQPSDAIACEGSAVLFSVTASSAAPLSFQWRKDGVTLPGETSSSLIINPVGSQNGGNYDVVVSNSCGSTSSNSASLTVGVTPSVVVQPTSQNSCEGGAVTFSVGATGTAPLVSSGARMRWISPEPPPLP